MGAMPDRLEYMLFEGGNMSPQAEVNFFQKLIDSGELETLGARYQRRAKELIQAEEVFDE